MDTTKTLFELIQRYGTVRELSDFLQSRGHGGGNSWAQLIDDRIKPALEKGKLSLETLLTFLRDAEEYGRQHVFLFRRTAAGNSVPSDSNVRGWLNSVGSLSVMDEPRILDLPETREIAEVRRDPASHSEILVIKVIERCTHDTLLRVTEPDDSGRYSKEYVREETRAVNVVRVHQNGMLEFRLTQHRGASRNYDAELRDLKAIVSGLIDPATLHPINLVKAKNKLYEKRHELNGTVSFSSTHIRDSDGVSHTAACGGQVSLFSFSRTEQSIATLTADGEAYPDSLNVWWLKQEQKPPHQKIHVLLSGADNEFAITQQCSRGDYEHVLGEILRFNT